MKCICEEEWYMHKRRCTCPSSFLLLLEEVLSMVRYWTRTMCLLVTTSSGAFMMR